MDVTDLVEDLPRTCDICEGAAEIECRDCFLEGGVNVRAPIFYSSDNLFIVNLFLLIMTE